MLVGGGEGVHWVKEKNSTKQKKPAHLVGLSMHARPRVWESCIVLGILMFQVLIAKGGVAISMIWRTVLFVPGPE